MKIFNLIRKNSNNVTESYFYSINHEFDIFKAVNKANNQLYCENVSNPNIKITFPIIELRRISKNSDYFEKENNPIELIGKFARLLNNNSFQREIEFQTKNPIYLNWIRDIENINYIEILEKIREHLFFSDNVDISHEAHVYLRKYKPKIILNFYLNDFIDLWVFAINDWIYFVRNDHSSVLYMFKNPHLAAINEFDERTLNRYFEI